MRIVIRVIVLSLLALDGYSKAIPIRASPLSFARPWTVADSVSVRYFVTDWNSPGWWSQMAGNPVQRAPDGRHFFFAAYHGDLASDRVVYELQVFATADPERASPGAHPQSVVRTALRGGSSSIGGMSNARWAGPDTILFFGVDGETSPALYRLTVSSGRLERLTGDGQNVKLYNLAGNSMVYAIERTVTQPVHAYPQVRVTGANWGQLASGEAAKSRSYPILVSYHGSAARQIAVAKALKYYADVYNFGAWTSPDGRWAIAEYEPQDLPLPAAWSAYAGKPNRTAQELNRRTRFMLLDLEQGQVKPLLDAPTGLATTTYTHVYYKGPMGEANLLPEVLWSEDSAQAIVINTALPLDESHKERQHTGYLIDYVPSTGKWTVLEPMMSGDGARQVKQVGWLTPGKEVLVTHWSFKDIPAGKRRGATGMPLEGTVYTLQDGHWIGRTVPATEDLPEAKTAESAVHISLKQSANDPPVLVAEQGNTEMPLTRPDPALRGLWRARAETVEWKESEGRSAKGLLMLLRTRSKSAPAPLVIQTYHYLPQLFRPDGHAATAYAAQTLVAKGIAVLQLEIAGMASETKDRLGTPQEGQLIVERIDAAVDSLAGQGLVDRNRVGLIGFSRGGYNVYYTITNPGRTRIAASVIADSFTASYLEYLHTGMRSSGSDGNSEIERIYGHGAFWQNKSMWMERAPSFNVNRVQGATLLAYNGSGAIDISSEFLGAFQLNHKPVEFLMFPDGIHQLQRPRERFESLTATVDWFNFWLQGKEEPDPTKHDEYLRWRKIRSDWQATQSAEVTILPKDHASP